MKADYSGDYRPDFKLTDLDHSTLAWYGREVMLANHIHDRAIMPQLAMTYGMSAQTQAACDEWMGSSPIYNYRNRSLLNIGGDNVETILKAFQFDIGAPHTFLQFHFALQSPEKGQFWLPYCGAYNHVRRLTNADPKSSALAAAQYSARPTVKCRPRGPAAGRSFSGTIWFWWKTVRYCRR